MEFNYKTKVKIFNSQFDADGISNVEEEINSFLKNKNITMLDIKVTSLNYADNTGFVCWTMFYEDKDKEQPQHNID